LAEGGKVHEKILEGLSIERIYARREPWTFLAERSRG
jgi:hypothetical protein